MSNIPESTNVKLIDDVSEWLLDQALSDCSIEKVLDGCFRRLHAAGVPLVRAHVAFSTLHPLYGGISITWTTADGLMVTAHEHEPANPELWLQSPLKYVIDHRIPSLRRRLNGPNALMDFPVLEEFKQRGFTDYLVYIIPFSREVSEFRPAAGMVGSWCSDLPTGFQDEDLRALSRIQKGLAVALKVHMKDQIGRNVAATYLGVDAGKRVLEGQIKRGDGDNIHAVIWYSDLRDSTHLADSMVGSEFLEALNRYFECSAGAVLEQGGEVLRFIGDAVLAIFPFSEHSGPASACRQAESAARRAFEKLEDVNTQRRKAGLAELKFGLGLHLGFVLFGNIGVPERLEFSVIGPSANEAARLEGLTKTLGHNILASGEFVDHSRASWRDLGEQEIRGAVKALSVFALIS